MKRILRHIGFMVLMGMVLQPAMATSVSDSLKNLIPSTKDHVEKGDLYLELSREYRKTDLDSSAFFIKMAILEGKKSQNEPRLQRYLMSQAAIFWMQGNLDSASMNYSQALTYWRKKDVPEEITRCLLNLGTVYHSMGESEKAIPLFREGLQLATEINATLMEAQIIGSLGNAYHRLAQDDSTLYYRELALKKFTEMADTANMTRSETNLALFFRESGHLAKGRTHYQRAMELVARIPEKGLKGEVFHGIGVLEYRAGNLEEAITHLSTARKNYQQLGWYRNIANTNILIGHCMKILGRHKAAAEQYQRAYELADSIGARDAASNGLTSLGDLAIENGDYTKAIEHFREAIAISYIKAEDPENYPRYMGLGMGFLHMNQQDSADHYIKTAFGMARQSNNEFNLGNGFLETGEIAFQKGNINQARQHADSAIKWFSVNNYPRGLTDAYSLLSKCLEQNGKYADALNAQRLAMQWRDSVFSSNATQSLLNLEAELWSEKKQHKLELAEKNNELQAKEAALAREESEKFASQRNLLITVLGLLLVFGSVVYYLNGKRKENEMQHKISEMRMMALRAQMNPHFIFNALGSVQLLINTQKTVEANLYLSKFARLLRRILERSSQSMLTLEDELEGLQLYIELEALRFKFQFDIQVAPALSPAEIQLPGMLIQPFVENAIKHGLSGRKAEGRLHIHFRPVADEMEIIIEDNGRGRAHAGKIRRKAGPHASMGTTIVQEQLQLLEPQRKDRLQITDLTNDAGEPSGTRVTLIIPLNL